MAVTSDKPVPYAPTSTVLEVIARYRSRGLPTPVTRDVLVRAGIAETVIPRLLQALQTLDLIDDGGQPTATLEAIRKAPEAEYKQRLLDWLNGAYADALKFIDPATADEVQVRDAFRGYNPIGQQDRMVSLFMGLYAAAGMGTEKAGQPRQARPSQSRTRSTTQQRAYPSGPVKLSPGWTKISRMQSHQTPGLPPALAGLMASLPEAGKGWTEEKRDQFVTLFRTALDWCFPIITQEQLDAADDDEAA